MGKGLLKKPFGMLLQNIFIKYQTFSVIYYFSSDIFGGKMKIKQVGKTEQKSVVETKSRTQTLFSSGILSNSVKKNNEYFGGDSTVTSAGDEDEDEETETATEDTENENTENGSDSKK